MPNNISEAPKSHLPKRIILHSLRLPLFFILISLTCNIFSLMANIYTKLSHLIINILDKLSYISLAIAALIFAYNLTIFCLIYFEKYIEPTNKTGALILHHVRKTTKIIFFFLSICILLALIAPFTPLDMYLSKIIIISIIVSIGWIGIQMLYVTEAVIYKKMLSLSLEKRISLYLMYTKIHILKNIGVVIIFIISFAAVLMTFNSVRNIGISILASAGFLTALIGFSGQKTLTSIFSGLQIALSHPIKIGDMLFIDGDWGIVESISFTYVHLKMRDQRRMIVPITYFVEKKFENWTREGNSIRTSVYFNVDYMMPIEPLRTELDNILSRSKYWDGKAKKLMINKVGDVSVEIRIQVGTTNADHLSDFRAEIRENMLKFMREEYPDYLPKTRQITIEPSDDDKDESH